MAAQKQKIGILGLGRMGRCMVQGLIESETVSRHDIFFTTAHPESREAAARELEITPVANNEALVKQCDIIVLAVKPQGAAEVLKKIGRHFAKDKTLISIAASIDTASLEEALGKNAAVVRAMPNTPAFVRAGITAACLGAHASERDWQRTEMLFKPLGKIIQVEERHMNAVTGLSGCGPAYIYVVLESLMDGGIKVGLPRDMATQLAAQTVLGAAKMLLDTGRHPAALKDEVTTPAGCTIDGLMELEEGKLRVTLIKAVVQATKRASRLAKAAKKR